MLPNQFLNYFSISQFISSWLGEKTLINSRIESVIELSHRLIKKKELLPEKKNQSLF